MKHKLLCCTAFMCGIFTFPFASALEYHYSADLYPNHFYAPTSSNRALDIDSADNSGGAAIIVPSAGMGTDADSTAPREGSPVIPVGSYVDPWGDSVEQKINTDEKLNGMENVSFNRLSGAESGSYTAQTQLTVTNGHFGAVSIGNRKLFAYVYPGATYESMRKGACRRHFGLERKRNPLRPQSRLVAVFRYAEQCTGGRCNYLPHFAWCTDVPRYLGRTDCGDKYRRPQPHRRQPHYPADLHCQRAVLSAVRSRSGN